VTAYQNPFTSASIDPFTKHLSKPTTDTSMQPLEFHHSAPLPPPKRKWKAEIHDSIRHSITLYREQYERYLKMHNNTANKDVWKVYDHIAADMFNEMLG